MNPFIGSTLIALAVNVLNPTNSFYDIFRIDHQKNAQPFNLQIKGTNFQINVWRALLSIPKGCVVSYQDIATYIGHPKAFRGVANAIAINPVAYLIPCHRVIAKSGKFINIVGDLTERRLSSDGKLRDQPKIHS